MFVLTVECCYVTVGNRVVCWYENRSAAIKLCHVDFHTVMNVVHYYWKECSWLVQKLLSSYETSLIDCLCTLWNVTLRLEGVQLVPTGPAQLVLSHTVWLFLYTVEFCYIAVGRSAVGCYGNCSAVSLCDCRSNFCIFKLCPEWPHVNVFVLLRSLSTNGRVKCTFEYPTFSGKSLSLEKINEKYIL